MFHLLHSDVLFFSFFFFNDTATTEIYTLSLHDALPISPAKGLYASDLARRLHVDWQQIDPVLQALSVLDWVGTVQAPGVAAGSEGTEPRYMLLVDPQHTPLAPLVERLLLAPSAAVQPLWERTGLAGMTLASLLESRPRP